MTNRLLLGLLAVALVALGLLVFWGRESDEVRGRGTASIDLGGDDDPAAPRGEAPDRLEAPAAVAVEPEIEPEAEPASKREDALSAYEEELAEGHWVEGRVRFPEGTPLDEECFVIADGSSFEHGDDHRVRVETNGSFRVAFSRRTRKGRLRLDARYLHLGKSVSLEVRAADPVVLEPRLGGRIVGRLVPQEGTEVKGDVEGSVRAWSSVDQAAASAAVQGDLRFELNGLFPGGEYHVGFRSPEHEDVDDRRAVVRPGEATEIELPLRRGASVSGVLVDEAGAPVAGAQISVTTRTPFTVSGEGRTDAEGRFRLAGLSAGKVAITVERVGFVPLHRDVPELAAERDVTGLRLVLERGASVEGRVVFPDGTPAADARIRYTLPGRGGRPWPSSFTVRAGEDGAFVVAGLGDEPIRLDAWAVQKSTVDVVSAIRGKTRRKTERTRHAGSLDDVLPGVTDVVIRLGGGNTLAGIVLDTSGAPVREFRIRVTEIGDGAWDRRDHVSRKFEATDGAFELSGLPAGKFEVTASAEGFGTSTAQQRFLPGETEPLRFVIGRTGSIAGIVLTAGGTPIEGAWIEENRERSRRMWPGNVRPARSEADGSFLLADVEPGTFSLTARADGHAPSVRTPVRLEPGEDLDGVELHLRPGATLTGEVRGVGGRPDADREVTLWGWDTRTHLTARTDEKGGFRFDGAPPGRCRVSVEASTEDATLLFGPDADETAVQILTRTLDLEIAEGESRHVVLALPEIDVVVVRGRVLVGGEPLVRARVSAAPPEHTGRSYPSTRTDESGEYLLTLPCPGEYRFMVHDQESDGSLRTSAMIPRAQEFVLDLEFEVGSIAGTVRDSSGRPLAGVEVSVRSSSDGAPGSLVQVETDSDGRYVAGTLASGTYVVTAGEDSRLWLAAPSPEPGFVRSSILGIVVEAGATVRGVDFELAEGGRVRGRVFYEGQPRGECWITVRDEKGEMHHGGMTTESGEYHSGGVPGGRVTVVAQTREGLASRPVTATIVTGDTTDVDLEVVHTGSLRVALIAPDGELLKGEARIEGPAPYGLYFMKDRTWGMDSLAEGEYTIRASARGGEKTSRAVVYRGERTRVEIRFD